MYKKKSRIRIGMATCGRAAGAADVYDAFKTEIEKAGLPIELKSTGCVGLCSQEVIAELEMEGRTRLTYGKISAEAVPLIIEKTIKKGEILEEHALYQYHPASAAQNAYAGVPFDDEYSVVKDQVKIALKNCGNIDPFSIEDYLQNDGYKATAAILKMTPEQVIDEIGTSGIRGRGGAGFPTAKKWTFCRNSQSDIKYVICNADEGDPGAFMDRSVLEGDPHSVLEGMIIAGYAIGASHGFIYCRAEYPLALKTLDKAIADAKERNFLGENILGSDFSFDISIREGAGAFVCGEETALIASIEDQRGMPRPKPPFPPIKGLFQRPTVVNNVETLANLPRIITGSAASYGAIGTEKSKGTKVFALAGKVRYTGLIEVPMGMSLRKAIFDVGGGPIEGRKIKAAQLGGPSGGCVPEHMFDIPIDYESIGKTGAIMGSGGMVVMDETSCMVDIARFFLEFTTDESCGKCTPCRVGTTVMLRILERICEGKGRMEDIDTLEQLSETILNGALCGLGKTAPNPVLTTLRYFRHEYEAHILEKRCPAEVCKRLMPTPCQKSCPLGQDVASYVSFIALGKFKEALDVIRADNPLPSVCGRLCVHGCEVNCRRGIDVDEPVAIRALKRFAAEQEIDYLEKSVGPARVIHPERVAVIGSGPAGLTAAYDLVRMGYRVTVFEAQPFAGGLLRTAIPEYRLPRKLLDAEIKAIEALGVEIKTNSPLGGDRGIEDLLQEGFKAIFIATGASKSQPKKMPGGEGLKGIVDLMEFLKEANLNHGGKAGDRVIVIGAGHAAMDAARLSCRLGSKEVHLISQRSRQDMPFEEVEIAQAEKEGVNFHFQLIPREILGNNGKVSSLKCVQAALSDPDPRGRQRSIPLRDKEVILDADAIIQAQGREPDTSFIADNDKIERSIRNLIVVDPQSLQTTKAGVFAGGEVVSGAATVVECMAAGRGAARAIDRYLRGDEPRCAGFRARPKTEVEQVELTDQEADARRPAMPMRPIKKGSLDFQEVETGLTTEMAVLEAKRCLRCDL
ncbi:MAG: FAD-dependent oxidoreductase [Candidatus Aminicenantes bacterium]|nr:FAD-dependent oxidoreductase [Candidatus Aminicenantes bacterium]NIM81478.1 FAD-dependent oxidoreductase [Candidatus Aminicenantes bacterium]NIN20844.1 FAD-dependent oxidoreductase [Candidatus Aminicenantes bacterium]NIN44665.1 FAD-dependent oxidoreductase [Candidatus Aminicenantes bacterium]NIN87474.1 FAD-dependent oxidoreductase [Candidatus Aminicenantes bacterium]